MTHVEALTEALGDDYDRAVLASPGIDHFCASRAWILPANAHLHPPREDAALRTTCDGEEHYFLLRQHKFAGIRSLESYELMWGLACPIIGPRPDIAAPLFADRLLDLSNHWDVLTLAGLPRHASWVRSFSTRLLRHCIVQHGSATTRYIADLSAGVTPYFARRSPRFRRNLRRAERIARAAGITFERAHNAAPSDVAQRITAIEHRSWKGHEFGSIDVTPGTSFYGDMIVALHASGTLRFIVAQLDGADVGYILGGVLNDTYRGLQFSFDDTQRELSLGNLMQLEQMHELVDDGITRYDLGTTADHYKGRWADDTMLSDTLRVLAPGLGQSREP